MKRPELLAPAGDYACFRAALKAGADAVYLGGDRYGARAFAANFSTEEIVTALKEAHFFGRKIYLTVNTLMRDDELADLPAFMTPLVEAGLDGVIVQDIGALRVLHREFPSLPLHASTQMTVTDAAGARYLRQFGVERVVPARELSLRELQQLGEDSGMEVEAFIHGAMCYCYSGQCLFSSFLGGRSGNRGRCAQPCRQPYHTEDMRNEEYYPLSLKDMCTIDHVKELMEAGIDSFKIEGRMKRPEYVAGVTDVYRRTIDKVLKGQDPKLSVKDCERLNTLYIRSEAQDGYLHRHNGAEMVTMDKPGYVGCDPAILESIAARFCEEPLTKPAQLYCVLTEGQDAELTAVCDGVSVTVTGAQVQSALKQPITEASAAKQLTKSGGTFFTIEDCQIYITGNGFLPNSALNDLRRNALNTLTDAVIASNRTEHRPAELYPATISSISLPPVSEDVFGYRRLHAFVTTVDQLRVCLKRGISVIYADHQAAEALTSQDWTLAQQNDCSIYLALPVVFRSESTAVKEHYEKLLKESSFAGALVSTLSTLAWMKEEHPELPVSLDHRMYLWNRETIAAYEGSYSYRCAPLEVHRRAMAPLSDTSTELMVYGRLPMMTTANCVKRTCGQCTGRRGTSVGGFVELTDRYRADFPVRYDCLNCMNYIYNSVPLSLHNYRHEIDRDYTWMRLDFTTENTAMTDSILRLYGENDSSVCEELKFTTGHFNKGAD